MPARWLRPGGQVLSTDASWQFQLLLRTRSEIPGRAEALLHALQAAFEQFAGHNYLRVCGLTAPGGRVFFGADSVWHRWWFDRRAGPAAGARG